jgi:tol-pal system protein YbgF
LSSSASDFPAGRRRDVRPPGGAAALRLPIVLAGIVALSAAACMATGAPKLRQDLDALRAEFAQLQKSNQQLAAEVKALEEKRSAPGAASADLADVDSRINSLEGQLAALRQRLDDAQERMNVFSVDLQAARELALRAQPPRIAPSQPPEGDLEAPSSVREGSATGLEDAKPAGTVEDTFGAAYADFTKGNYPLAIAGFQDFLRRYPNSELSDNAQFWIAESYFSQGDFDAAITEYDRVIQKYPKGDRVPAAYLKKALSMLEMNRTPEGVVQLQHLVQSYPKSEEAALARDRLEKLGVKP